VSERRRRRIDDLLQEAREHLDRVDPEQAKNAVEREGAVLVDIRSDNQRAADGVIPGAVHHPRNVLEWRLDPESEQPDPELSSDMQRRVIIVCDAGYASSLAAATAQELGYENATDLDGGFQAWRAAGLPVEPDGSP
jgi:rhodanese-related sulfurtransferase